MTRAALLVLVLAGCTDLFGPEVTFWNRRPMDPVPDMYPTWYAEVEACLGVRGNYEAVEWFVADSIIVGGVAKGGATEGDQITIWRGLLDAGSTIVKHESAHHITGVGDALHDDLGHVPCT